MYQIALCSSKGTESATEFKQKVWSMIITNQLGSHLSDCNWITAL